MRIRNSRSLLIIIFYFIINGLIVFMAYEQRSEEAQSLKKATSKAPEYTEILDLEYFHLKNGVPQLSISAEKMKSLGEELAEFESPRGIYNYQKKDRILNYEAEKGSYRKRKDYLALFGDVRISTEGAAYSADRVQYYFKKDLIVGEGGVKFKGEDPKSKDKVYIEAETMRANPHDQLSRFIGKVKGSMERKKKYEGKMTFSSQQLQMDGLRSLSHLEGNVEMSRDNYFITSGKADIHMENYNKSLKYFVLNDDVKVTETLQTATGPVQRRAYAERLEGFGREQKMVLSGAPRVEQGEDVVKGYRIIIRENVDLIEVEDAMSDVQIKKKKEKKTKD